MRLILQSIFLISILVGINSSPFEITENYIQTYRDGIAILKKEASEYHPEERSFEKEFKDAVVSPEELEFDFIIVGGGTSGSVLASRLTEIPEYKVLLLEAGYDETKITTIPGMADATKHKYNWGYHTEPQSTWCLGKETKQCFIPTPKILGGASSINDMVYIRGNERDYDLWADNGNTGWCYSDALPYFKKSEMAHLHHFDRKHHNQGGLLSVEDPQYLSNLHEHWLEAGKEHGFKVLDYNGKTQMGFGVPQMMTKHGMRQSSSMAFLKHFSNRKNLAAVLKAQVIEIIIADHTKEAQGVKYVHDGKIFVAKAKKEIIITSGAINTAQLLLLSGVGPKPQLEKLGIDCKTELPVGEYLKDHPTFVGLHYVYNTTQTQPDYEHDLVAYLKDGKGPMTTNGIEGLAFLKTKASTDTAEYPDIILIFIPDVYKGKFEIRIILVHPKSHGSVHLKSKDPLNWPAIDINHYSDEDDHDILTVLSGIRLAQKLIDTEAFKKLGATLYEHQTPGCESHEYNSDNYWKCAIRHETITAGHLTGTCKMGEKGVVDNHLRVRGLHKLRIADLSVVPISITGNTDAAAILIAEKAADLIKHDWGHPDEKH